MGEKNERVPLLVEKNMNESKSKNIAFEYYWKVPNLEWTFFFFYVQKCKKNEKMVHPIYTKNKNFGYEVGRIERNLNTSLF